MQRLQIAEREALELRVIDGLSSNEVGRVLGRRPGTVDVQVHRAMEKLRTWHGASATPAALAIAIQTATPAAEPSVALTARIAESAATGPVPTTLPMWPWYLAGGVVAAGIAVAAQLTLSSPVIPPSPVTTPVTAMSAPPVVLADPPRPQDAPWGGRAAQLLALIRPEHEMSGGMDLDWIKRRGVDLKPTSLFADPRMAPAWAEIRKQLALFAAVSPFPDYATAWDAAGGMIVSGTMGQQLGSYQEKPAFLQCMELGQQAQVVHERFQAMWQVHVPVRLDNTRWMTAEDKALLVQPKQAAVNLPLDAPLWIRWRDASFLPQFAALDRDRSDPVRLADWFGPNWRIATPEGTMRLLPGNGPWVTPTTVTGVAGPLHPLSAAVNGPLSGTTPCGRWAHAAIGLNAVVLRRLVIDVLPELPPGLTGDVAVTVDPGTPLPVFGLIIGLREEPGQRAGITRVLERFGAAALPDTNEGPAWTIAAPFGMVTIVLGRDRLVATTAADPTPWFAVGQADERLARGAIDPAALKPWLPMLWAQIPQKSTPFEETYLQYALCSLNESLAFHCTGSQTRQLGDPLAMFSQASQRGIEENGVDLRTYTMSHGRWRGTTESVNRHGAVSAYAALLLRKLSSGTFDPIRHMAVYRSDVKTHPNDIHFGSAFIRIGTDAWVDVGAAWSNRVVIRSRKELATATDIFQRPLALMTAIKAEDLEVVSLGERPEVRWRTWIPPLAVVMDHLPAWKLDIRQERDGRMVATEQGWPLLPIGVVPAVLDGPQARHIYHDRLDVRDAARVRTRHAARIAALEQIRQAIERFTQESDNHLGSSGKTPQLSSVLARSGCDVAVLAPLFQGRTPTTAEIDGLGRYLPCDWTGMTEYSSPYFQVAGKMMWSAPVLTVLLEPGWVALIPDKRYPDRRVQVTSCPFPTSAQPNDPKPGPAPGK
ncbi:MAG: sigma-70 region 4 domain-containing protein, partial [Planctomycetota bacterium]